MRSWISAALRTVLIALMITADVAAEPAQPTKPPRDPYRTAAVWFAFGGGALLLFGFLNPLEEFCYARIGDYDCEQPNWPALIGGGAMVGTAIALEHKVHKRKRGVAPFIQWDRRSVTAGARITFSNPVGPIN